MGISYRNEVTGLLSCYECDYSDENANTLRRHVEGAHAARNQTISIRTNVNPGDFVLPDIYSPPDPTPITPTIVVSDDTTLDEMATTAHLTNVVPDRFTTPVATVTPDETILDKRATTENPCADSADPVLSEPSQTPVEPVPISSETPQISDGFASLRMDSTTAASSNDDPPIQPPPTASPISRRTRQTARIDSPLKGITASVVNKSSRSEGRRAPPTGKNACPQCEERFDHSLVFHRRLNHIAKISIDTGPYKVEVKRGENGKFTCPLCLTWDNRNPEKLRVSAILLIFLELSDDFQQLHLPSCKANKESEDLRKFPNECGNSGQQTTKENEDLRQVSDDHSDSGRQTRQSRRLAQGRSIRSDNHRTSVDSMQLPPDCGDVDNEGDSTSGGEIHTMDIEDEGSLTPKESHRPASNVISSKPQTRNDSASPSISFILSKINLQVSSIPSRLGGLPHRLMVCTTCGMGLNPDNAVQHATSKDRFHYGHGITIPLRERTLVRQWIAMASDLHSPQNPPPVPDAHSPPVPGLKIFKGYKCPTCGECKESEEMMKRHSSSTGHRRPQVASVQFFFSTREKKYFVVQPGRQRVNQLEQKTRDRMEKDVDMYVLYAKSFGLDIEEKVPFYRDDKEMPQLLQITRWFDHVWPYLRLREGDVEEDGDEEDGDVSGDDSSQKEEDGNDEEGSDTGGEDAPHGLYPGGGDGNDETRAGHKRKRQGPNPHLTSALPPPQKRRKGNSATAWRGRMTVDFDGEDNYFSSDDDLMADSDEEYGDKEGDSEEDNDKGKDDENEDEGEGEDYDFVQLKNRRKISKKEQRRWDGWDSLTSVSKAQTLVSVRQPGRSAEEKACWYGIKLKDTISCYATSVGKEIKMSSSGFEIRRILGG